MRPNHGFYAFAAFVLQISELCCATSEDSEALAVRDAEQRLSTLSRKVFYADGRLNLEEVNEQFRSAPLFQELSEIYLENEKSSEKSTEKSENWFYNWNFTIDDLFSLLFPFGPAVNAILATTYISGPPNFLLALIPASIDPASLVVMVSFAVGGLLGDVFFHLLPQTFLGEHFGGEDDVLGSLMVVENDAKRNTVLGLGIFIGFFAFVCVDKFLRVLQFGSSDSHSHNHSHSHSHSHNDVTEKEITVAESSGASVANVADSAKLVRKRHTETESETSSSSPAAPHTPNSTVAEQNEPSSSIQLSAYLNLIADFTHNITDGLAIAASFYISRNVGATTCLAVFFHEIPHEIGDFALLIKGGFSKSRAMRSQFITAIGAYLGTFIGITLSEWSQKESGPSDIDVVDTQGYILGGNAGLKYAYSAEPSGGLFGTSVTLGEMILPFTAGGFLYIATVGAVPEILEMGIGGTSTRMDEVKKSVKQFIAVWLGIAVMFLISWYE